jgi:protein gp37
MGERTKIQWTDRTFNPWWGCTRVGPGCDHCYAEAFDKRTGGAHWGSGTARRRTSAKNWTEPWKWNAEAERSGERPWVFVASMADVFDNEVDPQWRADLWDAIRQTPLLRYQLLTKRIGNVPKMLPPGWPLGFEHVGIMATIVTADEMERDAPKLSRVKELGTTWTGISYEPALEAIDFASVETDWLIVGGESGAGARPFDIEWARSAVSQAGARGIPVFVKQLGTVWARKRHANDHKGGNWHEWPADLRVRQMPATQPGGAP